ncbi:response regulator [Paenibacillus aestuarii]|uniref:Response regulator n=1 Tax=Paenibacillus aestuarii TaxID=516965 RepID=A0ABW0K3A7_9BACL|nr:response regulator [Paenibacillus aestuarii]
MKKHESLLLQQVEDVWNTWRKQGHVKQEDLYSFLQSIRDSVPVIDRGELESIAYELLELGPFDKLTGLYDRTFLLGALERYITEARAAGQSCVLAAFDVAGFDVYQQQRGSKAGDDLVQRLSAIVKKKIKEQGLAVRDLADRFYVLFPLAGLDEARRCMEELRLTAMEMMSCRLTVIMLEADQAPDHFTTELILKTAETSLTQAKASGSGGLRLIDLASRETLRVRIAVIDDDPLMRSMLERQLSDLVGGQDQVDVEVRSFFDGEHFFQEGWFVNDGPMIVLLDQMMPRMNGMEVLSRLREQEDSSRYWVMVMTGSGHEDEIVEALEAGADDYFMKPFSLDVLKARIRRYIKGLMI